MAGSASVIRLPAVAALLLLTAACAGHPQGPAPAAACPAGDTAMVQATLFFGLDRPGGAPQITPREFDRFVDEVVSPTFPDGFTIQQAEGGWRDTETGATIREPSRTILILAPAADAAPLHRLTHDAELGLIRRLAEWPRVVQGAADAHEPHRIAFYLQDLAAELHGLWTKGREDESLRIIVADDPEIVAARLALIEAARLVIASGLGVMGVQPVEELH